MVLIGSKTVTVNVAFLREIKEVHEELWQLLRDVCSLVQPGIPHGATREKFIADLSLLRDQIALHFALEEAYGYFDEPAYVAPHLCERADSLRNEHRTLYMEISELAEDAESTMAGVHRDRRLVHRFGDFHRAFLLHEQAEEELILAIYDDDIGVGD